MKFTGGISTLLIGAIGAQAVSHKHPHIWHIENHGTVTLYTNLPTATITSSVSGSSGISIGSSGINI